MSELLTPEQIAGIDRRDRFDNDKSIPAKRDRHALLRDREAIAERLEYRLEDLEAACRIYGGHEDWRPVVERARDELRALVTAIRGEK